jgi:hypothetical protein
VSVVVVRDGGKCENLRPLSVRERCRLRRDVVYARRGLERYGLVWRAWANPLTGLWCWRLDAGHVVAEVHVAGIMSFCNVTVDGRGVRVRYKEEEFAGFGGVSICKLRGTQHVLSLIEERVATAQRALEESREA